jgi:leucyl-tRNA synthetase
MRDWIVAELMGSPEGQARLSRGPYDVRLAKKVIVARHGATVNFVL